MHEHPILFTAESVRKILAGEKSQTRRICKDLGRPCPYGAIGDRLWVKEAIERDGIGARFRCDHRLIHQRVLGGQYLWQWKRDTLSPLHMPKWAARLWLELTDVRVQRLREIHESDARAEGVEGDHGQALFNFFLLWKSIHGQDSVAANPWVWCLSFRVVQP